MRYSPPGESGSKVIVERQYDNFVGGKWIPPVEGRYFEDVAPITGAPFTEVARSDDKDIELALDAAHGAAEAWVRTTAAERASVLLKMADCIEEHLEELAVAETWDNGKPVRETLAADIPLAVDRFRYFASAVRAQEGGISEIDDDTIAYHFREPLGVVGQIIAWNFPIPDGGVEAGTSPRSGQLRRPEARTSMSTASTPISRSTSCRAGAPPSR